MWIWWTALMGCGGPTECGVAECADVCAKAAPQPVAPEAPEAPTPVDAPAEAGSPAGLSDFESGLVGPILEDLRSGVRPWNEEGVGICEGSGKDCRRFLGLSPGELPPGDYLVRAELAVPNGGERGTWKVQFDVECTTTRTTGSGTNTSTSTQSKEYTVFYAGEDRGYRLQPLWTIESPSPQGERECTYKLTAPHPDKEPNVLTGAWRVPAAE